MTVARGARGVPVAVLLATLWHTVPVALASQVPPGTATRVQETPPSQDPEADRDRAAPVLVGGEAIIWITAGVGPYTPQFRADRISQRLRDAIRDRSQRDTTVTVVENEGSSELRSGSVSWRSSKRSFVDEARSPRGTQRSSPTSRASSFRAPTTRTTSARGSCTSSRCLRGLTARRSSRH